MRLLCSSLIALITLSGCAKVSEVLPWTSSSTYVITEDPASPEGDTEVYDTAFPIQAGSWGGKVRAGPGMEYEHLTSLKEGDPVTLLGVSDVVMNGYPWFHIQYRTGQEGFKWGGILCAKDVMVDGLYENCQASEESATKQGELIDVRPNEKVSALVQIEKAFSLVPGRWQSTSDSKSVVVFDSNRGTHDIYEGVEVTAGSWTLEESEVSPTKVTLRRTIDGNVDVYSILFLNSTEMTLSFLPRSNTLSYKRMK
jgi:hypothetical protein